MKKIKHITYVLLLIMILSLMGCSTQTSKVLSNKVNTKEELSTIIEKETEDTITQLNNDYEKLKAETDTYSKYKENKDKIKDFYNNIYTTQKTLNINLREYCLAYTENIINSNISSEEKYDKLEELFETMYDDISDDIYDDFYDGILEDMYDTYYDGVIKDAYDKVSYEKWYDTLSEEYDIWSDTRSDVYDDWADFKSDIFDFTSDVASEVYEDDTERINKIIQDFKDDIEKLKSEN